MFEGWSDADRELAERVLDRFRQTAVAQMQPEAAHPPGCDAGDEGALLEVIFGKQP